MPTHAEAQPVRAARHVCELGVVDELQNVCHTELVLPPDGLQISNITRKEVVIVDVVQRVEMVGETPEEVARVRALKGNSRIRQTTVW